MIEERKSRTKGRAATAGVIPGRFALSVGKPELPEPNGWRWTALGDVAQLESGHTPSRKIEEYWGGDHPWIGIRDAVQNHGRTLYDTNERVTADGLANSSARLLPPRTVCLSRTASVGFVVVMGRSMATSQDFVNWVCGPGLEPEYLKYVLLAERDSLLSFASGTTHQTIYYPEAKAFHALLPGVATQRAIVRILGALDDKIDLNRRTNETLEALARALFQSWFVDFDPVRAKMDGRKPAGMDAETAKLFPAAMAEVVDPGVGEMPTGWERVPLSSAGELFDGPHATPAPATEGPVFLGIRNFRPTSLDLTEVRHIAESDFGQWTRRVQPRDGDIAFTYEATLGFFALIPPHVRCCLGRRTALYRPRAPESRWFAFHWFTSEPFQAHLQKHKQPGSTVDRIWLTDFPGYPLLKVPSSIERRFTASVAPVWRQIHNNQAESRTLAALRDALLPKLLSGEFRVPDAERAVSAAL